MVERRNLGNLLLWNQPVMKRTNVSRLMRQKCQNEKRSGEMRLFSVKDLLIPTQEVQHVEAVKHLNLGRIIDPLES